MTSALAARVRGAADVLLGPRSLSAPDELGALLQELVVALRDDTDDARLWLLMTCVASAMPEADALRAVGRAVRTRPPGEAVESLMSACLPLARTAGRAGRRVTVVTDRVLVDVHQAATSDAHRGIGRVVRGFAPRWLAERDVQPLAWSDALGLYRTLTPAERGRVVDHEAVGPQPDEPDEPAGELVVPWRCVLVLPEVPLRAVCGRLAALAASSGNAVSAIGYDTSPVVAADLLPPAHVERFVQYLGLVKHVRRVAAISGSAAGELTGFSSMVAAQGLPGPEVVTCSLPSEAGAAPPTDLAPGVPSVLAVGSLEPRKNPLALLHVAECLWREGHAFSLTVVASLDHAAPEVAAVVRRLHRRGRDLRVVGGLSEAQLRQAYAAARFTVFCSLHEGYGLPVAESLAVGTPVVTSSYGSTREIAQGGGAVLVDPRSDDELLSAVRSLLTDDGLVQQLRAECAARTPRTWQQYADELWDALVTPLAGAPS